MVTGDGVRFYHLYVGTQRNCVVDLTFSVKPGTTDIQDFALEVLLQGHVSEIRSVQVMLAHKTAGLRFTITILSSCRFSTGMFH